MIQCYKYVVTLADGTYMESCLINKSHMSLQMLVESRKVITKLYKEQTGIDMVHSFSETCVDEYGIERG